MEQVIRLIKRVALCPVAFCVRGRPGQAIGRGAVLLALFLHAPLASAQTPPAPFAAEYEGSKFPFSAKAEIALVRSGDYYRYTMRGRVRMAFYRATETYDCTVVRMQDGALVPVEYVHRDRRTPRHNVQVRFDWSRNTISTRRGDEPPVEVNDAERYVWDPMSVQVRLRMDAANAQPGARFDYAVVERGGIARYGARYEQVETIQVGEHALKAARIAAKGPKRVNTFWFAPDYAWLPVRMDIAGVTLRLASAPAEAARRPAPAAEAAPRCE